MTSADSSKLCAVPTCTTKIRCKGYCSMHYRRWLHTGTTSLQPKTKCTCSVAKCQSQCCAKGLCNRHYIQMKKFGSIQREYKQPKPTLDFIHNAITQETDQCILWPFATVNGYGYMLYKGSMWGAPRLALHLATGRLRDQACHGPCHNRLCLNPKHLYWGDNTTNSEDKKRDGTHLQGERAPTSKLTEQDVIAILQSSVPNYLLANRFNVSRATITNIKKRKSWKHIKQPE